MIAGQKQQQSNQTYTQGQYAGPDDEALMYSNPRAGHSILLVSRTALYRWFSGKEWVEGVVWEIEP